MIAFIDFEASSLAKDGYPIEVGWVFEDGRGEGRLIRPAPGWTSWDEAAEAVHGLPRARLEREGDPHDAVAHRVLEVLSGHQVYASAPSWDGQWLSLLLRSAGLPRHALRLRDTEEAHAAAVADVLAAAAVPDAARKALQAAIFEAAHRAIEVQQQKPLHRALDDARRELALWCEIRRRAEEATAQWKPDGTPGA